MPPLPRKALLRAQCRCRFLEAEGDRHEFCFVCLGPRHARDGLVDSPACTECASLSKTERHKRHEYFQVEEPLADVVSALLSDEESSGSDDLGLPEVAGETALGQDPPVEEFLQSVLRSTPLSVSEGAGGVSSSASEEDGEAAPAPPASSHLSRSADFPILIAHAASIMGVPMPVSPPVEQDDPWDVGPYAKRSRPTRPACPAMPKLANYVEGSWDAPMAANAPVKALLPFSRVDGMLEAVKAGPPPLEPSLVAYLVPGASAWSTNRKATLPSPRDRLTTSLADKVYVWGAQAAAASSNAALLMAAVTKLSTGKTEGLSAAEASLVARMTSAAVFLAQGAAICSGRSMASSVVIQRNLWLSLTAMRDADKTALLNAPVSKDGLFGPAVASASERFSRLEAERKHLSGHMPLQRKPPAASSSLASAGTSQGRKRRPRRPAAASRDAAATQAPHPPSTSVPHTTAPAERTGFARPPAPAWRGGQSRKRKA